MASSQTRMLKLVIGSKSNFSSPLRHFSSIRDHTSFNSSPNPNFEEDDARKTQNPPEPIPHRPLRGERGERSSYQFQSQPNKPFRAEERGERSGRIERPSQQSQSQSQFQPHQSPRNVKFNGSPNQIHQDNHRSDADFLEKFKLGLDKRKENETSLPNNPDSSPADDDKDNENEDKDSPSPDANQIFKKMKETGLIPNAVAMLDGLCKDGLVQDAMKLFGVMREKGTMPEVVVYTAVVDGFCKAKKLDDAKRIFRKMLDNGITPNAFSYTVLIQGLYKCDSIDDAVDFSFQMLDSGHSPNVATFVGLIDGLCKHKGIEEAKSVIEALRKKGFFVNEKGVREFLDRNLPLSSPVWEAALGRKHSPEAFLKDSRGTARH